jgi:hypothetical protein
MTKEEKKLYTQQTVGTVRKILQKYNGFDIEEIKITRRQDFRSSSNCPRFDIEVKYSDRLQDYPPSHNQETVSTE